MVTMTPIGGIGGLPSYLHFRLPALVTSRVQNWYQPCGGKEEYGELGPWTGEGRFDNACCARGRVYADDASERSFSTVLRVPYHVWERHYVFITFEVKIVKPDSQGG